MYFQKLENLKNENIKLELIVDSLDQWLAYVPNSYKNKIWPELYANKEGISIDVCIFLFEKLAEIKVLKERFVVECSCGHVLEISNSLENALDFIIEYNDEELSCNSCGEYEKISTDNVYVIYELIEKPQMDEMLKKKGEDVFGISMLTARKNLSEMISDNPEKYANLEIGQKLMELSPDPVRKKLLALQDGH